MSNRPKINRNIFALADIVLTIWSLSVFDLEIHCHDTNNEDGDQFDDASVGVF